LFITDRFGIIPSSFLFSGQKVIPFTIAEAGFLIKF